MNSRGRGEGLRAESPALAWELGRLWGRGRSPNFPAWSLKPASSSAVRLCRERMRAGEWAPLRGRPALWAGS